MADTKLMDYLCKLAKLSFDDDKKQKVALEMESILNLMDSIKDVEIKAEDYPLAFPGQQQNLRADEVGTSLPIDEALANVPDRKFHFIAVKKIIGE
ncbi:MAG: Asp-tRNA(Asn)/Glu-tRNA(Gln) amidotransferase subunit GatC [Clostridia bacterium]|nr:Asp-tRNA(Asn)/Glu-tRNA(Gln) amidotransferase subunit GatC [Clostridia bacterium]